MQKLLGQCIEIAKTAVNSPEYTEQNRTNELHRHVCLHNQLQHSEEGATSRVLWFQSSTKQVTNMAPKIRYYVRPHSATQTRNAEIQFRCGRSFVTIDVFNRGEDVTLPFYTKTIHCDRPS